MKKGFLLLSVLILSFTNAIAESSLRAVSGIKFPNDSEEGTLPVETTAWTLTKGTAQYPGYSELIPYLHRAPHQQDAGSCLYMSLTGIAEFWLARLNPSIPRHPDGPLDLSERFLMNRAGLDEDQNGTLNWRTDSIVLFNRAGGAPRNVDYRFTKGWVTKNSSGAYIQAPEGAPGAEYGTKYNWIDELDRIDSSQWIPLPLFQRDVLFADPASDQWNVGVMPDDIVERIKKALLARKAPVHVVYNHYGYWHAVNIVGFDDEADTKGCTFVNGFFPYMEKQARDLRAQAAQTNDPAEKQMLLKRANASERTAQKARAAYKKGGGCHPKGMFYVRDSLYGDPQGPVYDYDPSRSGEEAPYPMTVVLHEYDWIRYLGNHATQIYLK